MPKRRIILSGGPGTGKTTIMDSLEKMGYSCFKEVSREIIDEETQLGSGIVPWDKLELFTERVLGGRVNQFNKAGEGINFYDRSILDSLAYMKLDNLTIRSEWLHMADEMKYYEDVFITPPWEEIYRTDSQRKESYTKLLDIHEALLSIYTEYNYKINIVPLGGIEERIHFILKSIGE